MQTGGANSWEQRKVSDVVGITYGGGTPATSNEEYWKGVIPWIQSSNAVEDQLFDIDVKKHISKDGLTHSAAQLIPENSVAVVTHVGVGKLVFMPYSYTTSQDFISLSDLKCDPKFLCYALYKKLQEDLHIVQGSAIKGITKEDLMGKRFCLPEIDEQRKIADTLLSLARLIALHQQKYFLLKILCYYEIFITWEQRKVGELTNVLSASRVHKEDWTDEGVPFFRSSDVVAAFKGTENDKAFISFELYEQLTKSSGKLEKNDILITGGRSIGIPYIVPDNEALYSKDADLIWIKHSANFDSRYLYIYFTSKEFRDYLSSISHTGTIAHYTIEQVKDTPVRLSSIDEQKQIGAYFDNLDRLIALHQRKANPLKMLVYRSDFCDSF